MASDNGGSANAVQDEVAGADAPQKLNLDVKIASPSACQRHVTVTVPRDDIDRYFSKAVGEMSTNAAVPGFRAGRAPKKLVASRFRKEVLDQVKGSLLMDSIAQVTEDSKLSAISEPDFDPVAVAVPDSGPLTFEFDIEVRPEFDLPNWKGLKIERPVYQHTEKDIDRRLEQILGQFGRLTPFDGAAETGDYIACNLTFKSGDEVISQSKEEVIRIRPVLSFRDGKIEKFDKALKGVRGGETREAEALLSQDAPNVAMRGKKVSAVFEVLEVKKLELPELTPQFLAQIGFESVEDLRGMVRANLDRQFEYRQRQEARRQITSALTANANWELPKELLRRQSRRELDRAVLEMRRNGLAENEIRMRENDLRQNSAAVTARALKEHFILERIAEEEGIEANEQDYEHEIELIAEQSEQSPRRVRARLEKNGLMDSLRNQIIERKAVDLVLSHAEFKDLPYKPEQLDVEALEQAAGGEEQEDSIPEAKHAEETEPPQRTSGQERP